MGAARFARSPHGVLVPFRGTDGRTGVPFDQVLSADAGEGADEPRSIELIEVLNDVEAADAAFRWVQERPVVTVGLLGSYNRQLLARDVFETIAAPMGAARKPDEPLLKDRATT